MIAQVENSTTRDVKIVFCSLNPGTTSKIEVVPAGTMDFQSSTFKRTFLSTSADHTHDYVPHNSSYDTYAALSQEDLNFVKICSSIPTVDVLKNRVVDRYLIVELADTCPNEFIPLDQSQNPCIVTF